MLKAKMVLTLEIDEETWAATYGVSDVPADVQAWLKGNPEGVLEYLTALFASDSGVKVTEAALRWGTVEGTVGAHLFKLSRSGKVKNNGVQYSLREFDNKTQVFGDWSPWYDFGDGCVVAALTPRENIRMRIHPELMKDLEHAAVMRQISTAKL